MSELNNKKSIPINESALPSQSDIQRIKAIPHVNHNMEKRAAIPPPYDVVNKLKSIKPSQNPKSKGK